MKHWPSNEPQPVLESNDDSTLSAESGLTTTSTDVGRNNDTEGADEPEPVKELPLVVPPEKFRYFAKKTS